MNEQTNDMRLPASTTDRPGAGRPTREQAQRRHEELLDVALEMFLDGGFEQTSIDAIAAAVGMTKRTVYARYPDKRALFSAAIARAIERWTVPIDTIRALETPDLEETLLAVARLRLDNALGPAGRRLERIVYSEAFRFPEMVRSAHEKGTMPTLLFLGDLFTRHADADHLRIAEPDIVASAFLSLVVGVPIRAAAWGMPYEPAAVDRHLRTCIRLFMDGIRARD